MTSTTTSTEEEDNGTNSSLPEELVEKILLRLPAKSLVRFKLVCKSWRSLITDRSFAKKHLHANTGNSKKILFLLWNDTNLAMINNFVPPPIKQGISLIKASYTGDEESLSCDVDEPNLPRTVRAKLAREDFKSFMVAFHCNGVVCVSESNRGPNSKIVLVNPALKQRKCFTRPFLNPHRYMHVGEGFGYDSRTDDFKFIAVWCARNGTKNTARVYSLRNDSWKEIKVNRKLNLGLFSHEAAYVGGVYYWRNMTGNANSEDMVVAFDFSGEKFHRVPFPDCIREVPMYWKRLALWGDSVVVFNMFENSVECTVFEMWVMVDKFGGSWTKHLTIGPLTNTQNPLWFWNDDELLMGTMEREIVSYNLHTKKLRTLPTGDAIPRASYHLEYYTESLISILKRV